MNLTISAPSINHMVCYIILLLQGRQTVNQATVPLLTSHQFARPPCWYSYGSEFLFNGMKLKPCSFKTGQSIQHLKWWTHRQYVDLVTYIFPFREESGLKAQLL